MRGGDQSHTAVQADLRCDMQGGGVLRDGFLLAYDLDGVDGGVVRFYALKGMHDNALLAPAIKYLEVEFERIS